MAYRLGSAFVLLGVILLTLFVVTLTAEQGDPLILLAGAGLSLMGLVLRRRGAARVGSSRFQTLRKLLGSEEKEE
ncbi:MAG TPA: hypothetical protein VGA07_02095 [Anaerolineales bacterium]